MAAINTHALNPTKPAVLLNWAGRSVSQDLSPFVVSITYTESLRKKNAARDKISLVLNNKDRIFCDKWYPKQGDTLKPGLIWLDLITGASRIWHWGAFTIDDIQFRFAPDQVVIGALATSKKSDKLEQANNRSWENISLKQLCTTLAGEANLSCSFNGDDVMIPFVQQRNESSRELLQRLSEQYDLPVAVKNEMVYVGTPKLGTLTVDMTDRTIVKSADIVVASNRHSVGAVEIEYYDPQKKALITYKTGGAADDKHTQRIYNAPVSSPEEAKRYAQSLGKNNGAQHEAESRLVLINTPVAVGQPVKLTHIGQLPSSFTVAQQTTSVTAGHWQTTLKMTKS